MNPLYRIAIRERIIDAFTDQEIGGVLTADDAESLADIVLDILSDEEGITDAIDTLERNEDTER